MQTLMLKNETLSKEIEELESKIKKIEEADEAAAAAAAAPDKNKKKSKFATLPLPIFQDPEAKEKRSEKVKQAIKQLHQLLLDGKFDRFDEVVAEKKKLLFPKQKKSAPPPRPLDLKDDYGETALMKAVKQSKLDIVEQLLELGASIDTPDTDGETPLMTAAKYGQLAMVQLLVAKANRDAKTTYTKKTALHFAAQYGHLEVVDVLLKNGCDATLEDVDGNTALQLAKNKEVFGHIRDVLKKQKPEGEGAGAKAGSGDEDEDNEELAFVTGKDEYDPFKMMKKERSYSQDEDMKPLIEKNKELEAKKQNLMLRYDDLKAKRRPKDNFDILKGLDSAARRKFLGLADAPKDQLVDQYHSLVLQGDNPGAIEDVERMLTDKKKKKVQVDKDAVDEFGETALMKAARLGYLQMLDLLILYKCDIDMKDNDGYNAVMKAAQFGKMECLQRLIEEGAELDMTTRVGKLTALMLAAQRGHGEVAKLLIQEGANHQCVDSTGNRAVDMALNPEAKAIIEEAMLEHPMMQNNVQI